MNQIVEAENKDVAQVPPQVEGSFLQIISDNPNMSPETIHSLLDANERYLKIQAEIAFNEAMARLQPKLPQIEKTAKAHNSKYAKLESIDKIVRPLYTAEGFSISFNSKRNDDGTKTYYGTLSHAQGHSKTAEITLPDDTSGSKNAIQAVAATVSYAERYLTKMLLNIIEKDEDTDGNYPNPLTEEQAKKIKDLLELTSSDVKAFLELFGYPSVDEADQRDFRKMNALLIAKREGMKGGENAKDD